MHGRDLDVYTIGVITCRPTQREAEEYYRYTVIENADWTAVDAILKKRGISAATSGQAAFEEARKHQANGMGGLPLVGDPDRVAQQLIDLSTKANLRGIGASFVNYADELPYFCAEVLPRLERAGVREKS